MDSRRRSIDRRWGAVNINAMSVLTSLKRSHFRLRPLLSIAALTLVFLALLVLLFQPHPDVTLNISNLPTNNVSMLGKLSERGRNCSGSSGLDCGTWGNSSSSGLVSTMLTAEDKAVCVGSDAARGEVEDLLCLPKPDYDKRMKNPCWWEDVTVTPAPQLNSTVNTTVTSLSCLPYFHILCCSKSGTTDMYRRISMHHDIVPNLGMFGKERLWWSWGKYGFRGRHDRMDPVPFYKYIKGFGILARYLEQAAATGSTKDMQRLITLDGSPPDMWDLRGWIQLPQNRNLRHPAVVTPHLMRHLYRDPKFLILAREPVERIYTAYLFHGMGRNPYEFHEDAIRGMEYFDSCLARAENRIECFVNESVLKDLPIDIHYSCYAVWYAEWLKVFPRKHFLFLRTEQYSADLKGSLYKIFKFLELPKPSTREMQQMLSVPNSYHTKARDFAGPMLNETRELLNKYFQPWNRELATLMRDKGYLWNRR